MLFSGQINILSSEDESDEDDALAGISGVHHKNARVPKIKYRPDVERIEVRPDS